MQDTHFQDTQYIQFFCTAKLPHLHVDDPESIEFRENLSFRVPVSVPVSWTE